MALMNLQQYKKTDIPLEYWEKIADYLSCCDKEISKISEDDFTYLRWNERKVCFQALLYALEIPRELHEKISNEIRCPECGKKIELNSYISINYSYQSKRYRIKLEKYIRDQTRENINLFINFLHKYPFLGLENKTGRKIQEEIKNLKRATITIKDEIWYRARNLDKDNPSKIFSEKDMDCPPSKKAREGRFNHYGQRALYLGSFDSCCVSEINKGNFLTTCWIQKVRVIKANIIDLTNLEKTENLENCPLFVAGLIVTGELENHNPEHNEYYKPEYVITQFLADLCRFYKIDGIKYKSTVSEERNAINLVLFKNNHKLYELIDNPKLYNGFEKILFHSEMEDSKIIFISSSKGNDK